MFRTKYIRFSLKFPVTKNQEHLQEQEDIILPCISQASKQAWEWNCNFSSRVILNHLDWLRLQIVLFVESPENWKIFVSFFSLPSTRGLY